MKKLEIIDISVLVREDPDNYVKEVPIIPIGGDIFNGFRINLNVHYGTHIDAPCHRILIQKPLSSTHWNGLSCLQW